MKNKLDFNLGDSLKNRRLALGQKQNEIAEKVSISVQRYSNYENNHRTPDEPTLKKILEVLDIKLSDLLLDYSNNKQILVNRIIEQTKGSFIDWVGIQSISSITYEDKEYDVMSYLKEVLFPGSSEKDFNVDASYTVFFHSTYALINYKEDYVLAVNFVSSDPPYPIFIHNNEVKNKLNDIVSLIEDGSSVIKQLEDKALLESIRSFNKKNKDDKENESTQED